MNEGTHRGGCRCGTVRLTVGGEPDAVVYCHCGDCRRSNGAPLSLFVGYEVGRIEMSRGTPKVYESAPGVRRSFCGDCGTSMFYEDERLPGKVYISIGVFDAPESFEPEPTRGSPRNCRGWISGTICPGMKQAATPAEGNCGVPNSQDVHRTGHFPNPA